MASKTAIANRALISVGLKKVVNLTDDTPEARIINLVYDESLDSVLEECMWSFATKRAVLSLTTIDPEWKERDMQYVYTRPADVIKIFMTSPRTALWREENDYIISDSNELGVLYVYRNTATASYSPKFVDAFACKLASDVAYYALNNPTRAGQLLSKYNDDLLPAATASNSQIGTPYLTDDNYWVDAKYGNANRKTQYGI